MEDKSVLRWGGLAGMLGGIVFIFVPVILFGFVPPAPADPAELVARFPTVRAAIAAGNFGDFVADALVLARFLALCRALRGAGPPLAPFLSYRSSSSSPSSWDGGSTLCQGPHSKFGRFGCPLLVIGGRGSTSSSRSRGTNLETDAPRWAFRPIFQGTNPESSNHLRESRTQLGIE